MLKEFNALPTLPLIGNAHLIFSKAEDRIKKLLELNSQYTTPFVFWFSYIPIVCVNKYKDIQVISNKSKMRDTLGTFKSIFGDGIILALPEKWKRTRKVINTAFNPVMLQQYLIVFNEQSEILCRKLSAEANTGKIIDMWQYLCDINLDIVIENMAGIKLNIQENGQNEFSKLLMLSLKLESSRFYQIWLYPDIIYRAYLRLTGHKDLYKTLYKFTKKVIETKMKEYQIQKQKMLCDSSQTEEKPLRTLIDLLLRIDDDNPDFTEQQIQEEIISMIAAGSETTALSTAFTLLMLAIHEDAQEKVYEEIQMVFKNDRYVQMDDLNQMKFLEQCIKETLRMFTLIPITFRRATEDITLNDNKIIPANCLIAIGYHGVHVDPDIYPNPYIWDPKRFSEINEISAFVPFGLGSRACVGSKYAMFSTKTQLIHILRKYRIMTNITIEEVEINVDLLIRKKGGYPIKFLYRKNDER
ncbi:hypothetical protein PGB90_006855 [Kerria lacca]